MGGLRSSFHPMKVRISYWASWMISCTASKDLHEPKSRLCIMISSSHSIPALHWTTVGCFRRLQPGSPMRFGHRRTTGTRTIPSWGCPVCSRAPFAMVIPPSMHQASFSSLNQTRLLSRRDSLVGVAQCIKVSHCLPPSRQAAKRQPGDQEEK